VKSDLEGRFPGGIIEITSEEVPGRTQCFDVQIVGGKLLHSKLNGDGYVDTPSKLEKIIAGIEEALKGS
jgi:selT/selW/selH-like putative selenoprotein